MKTKYQLMNQSVVTDKNGNHYADLATFDIDSFETRNKPADYKLTYNDTLKFYNAIYEFYGDFDFYDDLNLWLNNIINISDSDLNFQKKIKLYSKTDIDNFYINHIKE